MVCCCRSLPPFPLPLQVVDISMEDGRVRANMPDDRKIVVQDIVSETTDELEFRDKVIKTSLGEAGG